MTIFISGGGGSSLSAGSVQAQHLANSAVGQALGMLNGTLVASVATNILTVAIKTLAGTDPTSTDPVFFLFRDVTAATGDFVVVQLTSALSINTNATGATLGTANTVPFRIWVNVFNNAGTPVLALWQSVTGGATPTGIAALNEAAVASTTPISGTATAAGTFYTPNGTTLTSKAFRTLGYLDYASGLTTAGTYATGPTTIQLFGPGIKKPGDIVQSVVATTKTGAANTATSYATALSASITPTSTPNIVGIRSNGFAAIANGLNSGAVTIFRGTTAGTKLTSIQFLNANAASVQDAVAIEAWDAPQTASSQAYTIGNKGDGTNGLNIFNAGDAGANAWGFMRIDEMMV